MSDRFFGLVLQAGKPETVEIDNLMLLRVCQVALSEPTDNTRVVVSVRTSGDSPMTLGTLSAKGAVYQFPTDLIFNRNHAPVFSVTGSGTVHITGYFQDTEADDDEEEGEESEDEFDGHLPPGAPKDMRQAFGEDGSEDEFDEDDDMDEEDDEGMDADDLEDDDEMDLDDSDDEEGDDFAEGGEFSDDDEEDEEDDEDDEEDDEEDSEDDFMGNPSAPQRGAPQRGGNYGASRGSDFNGRGGSRGGFQSRGGRGGDRGRGGRGGADRGGRGGRGGGDRGGRGGRGGGDRGGRGGGRGGDRGGRGGGRGGNSRGRGRN